MQPTGQHHMVSAETRRNMSRSTTRTNTPIRGSQTLHKSFPWKQSLPVSLRLQDGHEDTTNLISFLLFWRCKADNRKKRGGGWKDQRVLHLFFARNYNKNNRTRENLSCVSRLLQSNNGGDEGGKEETGVLHKKMERPRFLFLLSLCLLWRERGFGGC